MLRVLGCITQQHDLRLVAVAGLLCFFACVTAMSMVGRARPAAMRVRLAWLGGAGLVAGCGIWATHFVAMLAYQPGLPVDYDQALTVLSALIAIAISAVGFGVALRPRLAFLGGGIAGAAIGTMHYVGMAAVRIPADAIWDPSYVTASGLVGVALMAIAMNIVVQHNDRRGLLAGAGLFTIAIVAMHFTAMAAVVYRPDPRIVVPNAVMAPMTLAIAVAAIAFLIVALGLVCALFDAHLERLATGEAARLRRYVEELEATKAALTQTQTAIRNLLDNADQGFLTITENLAIGDQFSAACETILGQSPARKPIADLLCGAMTDDAQATLKATLESIFRDSSDFIRELKLELLPATFAIDGKTVRTSYKFLADDQRLMIILTDTTETARLAEVVERERHRLEMIVLAVTEGDAFSALVEEYGKFLTTELPNLLQGASSGGASSELFRRLHTYKGLLSQFSFYRSPKRLHDFESKLAEDQLWSLGPSDQSFAPEMLLAELKLDLESVTNALGPDFVASGRRLSLSQRQLAEMKVIATDLLARGDAARLPRLRALLEPLADLGKLDPKAALMLHSRGALSLAARLEKQLQPIEVSGDDVGVDPDVFGEFFRSLVHVFRNAVDHGIETPDERLAAGKPVEGTIGCILADRGNWLEVLIEDDGRGVDRSLLEDKLVADGLAPDEVRNLSLADLVFREGVSSRDVATDISGRGVGLSAVKAELDRIGGSVAVRTDAGRGTHFRFRLPITPGDTPSVKPLEDVLQ